MFPKAAEGFCVAATQSHFRAVSVDSSDTRSAAASLWVQHRPERILRFETGFMLKVSESLSGKHD